MMERFLGAVQFLTVVPVRGKTAPPGAAAVFFPLVGAMLGASAGFVLLICNSGFGQPMGALLAVAWLIAITGCLHEDGLADVADAVRAGRTREKMMAILKDSRIGAYGAIALILSIAVRWQALAQTAVHPVVHPIAGLAAAVGLSRTSLVALAAFAPGVGTGLGQAFAAGCLRGVLISAVALAVAITGLAAIFIGGRYAFAMLAASGTIVWCARSWFTHRLGGVNGDCLGATCQAVEMVNMVILAWHPSF